MAKGRHITVYAPDTYLVYRWKKKQTGAENDTAYVLPTTNSFRVRIEDFTLVRVYRTPESKLAKL